MARSKKRSAKKFKQKEIGPLTRGRFGVNVRGVARVSLGPRAKVVLPWPFALGLEPRPDKVRDLGRG
jgi:hypothetical protein